MHLASWDGQAQDPLERTKEKSRTSFPVRDLTYHVKQKIWEWRLDAE